MTMTTRLLAMALYVVLASLGVVQLVRLRRFNEHWARRARSRLLATLLLCTALPIDFLLGSFVDEQIAIFLTAILVVPPALVLLQRGRDRDLEN